MTDDIIAYATSDERLKDNIAPIDDPLAKIISISGNTFDWNENTNNEGRILVSLHKKLRHLDCQDWSQQIMTKQSVMKNLFLPRRQLRNSLVRLTPGKNYPINNLKLHNNGKY